MSYYRASKEFTGYANSFQAVSRLGLESVGSLMKHLGNPQDKLRFIHVAGTNGKGSVCAFLQSMLTHAGLKTGLFTSPNMLCVNERVNIDGKIISDFDMKRMLELVETASGKVEAEIGLRPTQFEIWTAMALVYFCEQKCDCVVLETGLGGRLDATNIVTTTDISVITHIALDHTQYLGDTVAKIAAEKAGIIKPDTQVVSALQQEDALCVLRDSCEKKNCRLTLAEKIEPREHDGIYEIIGNGDFSEVRLSLGGINQLDNAACAIAAARVFGIDDEHIRYGLEHAYNAGRFERLGEKTYFDGAHNPDGVSALKRNIERYFPSQEIAYIMATMADKDIVPSARMLNGENSEFFAVAVKDNPRTMSAGELCERLKGLGAKASAYESIGEAYEAAKNSGKLIVLCGSLYLYKDFAEGVEKHEII